MKKQILSMVLLIVFCLSSLTAFAATDTIPPTDTTPPQTNNVFVDGVFIMTSNGWTVQDTATNATQAKEVRAIFDKHFKNDMVGIYLTTPTTEISIKPAKGVTPEMVMYDSATNIYTKLKPLIGDGSYTFYVPASVKFPLTIIASNGALQASNSALQEGPKSASQVLSRIVRSIKGSTAGSSNTHSTYTVNYKLNGGNGTVPNMVTKKAGESFTVASAAGMTAPDNKQFKEWNTKADGSGTSYVPGAAATMPANTLTLYAIWMAESSEPEYEITYNLNGGTGMVPTESAKKAGETFTVASATGITAPDNRQFKEWNTSADGNGTSYQAGSAKLMPPNNLTLYAVWMSPTYIEYTITYNLNGGTGTVPTESAKKAGETFTVASAAGITAPASKQFKEWNTKADGSGTAYAPGAVAAMPANRLTLYAIWMPLTISVRQDGSGDFTTIKEAVKKFEDDEVIGGIIDIGPGTFDEKIVIGYPVQLSGAGNDQTIITWNDTPTTVKRGDEDPRVPFNASDGTLGTFGSFTVGLVEGADNCIIKNLSIINDNWNQGQCEALSIVADKVIVDSVILTGYQDTLFVQNGRQYFLNCTIKGRTDYIFGNAQTVFENCLIYHVDSGGYITAPSTREAWPFGFLFINCKIEADTTKAGMKNSVSLGRPWHSSSEQALGTLSSAVAFINTNMSDCISAAGYTSMSGQNPQDNRMYEYKSVGAGAPKNANTAPTRLQLSDVMAANFTKENVFDAINGKYAEPWFPNYKEELKAYKAENAEFVDTVNDDLGTINATPGLSVSNFTSNISISEEAVYQLQSVSGVLKTSGFICNGDILRLYNKIDASKTATYKINVAQQVYATLQGRSELAPSGDNYDQFAWSLSTPPSLASNTISSTAGLTNTNTDERTKQFLHVDDTLSSVIMPSDPAFSAMLTVKQNANMPSGSYRLEFAGEENYMPSADIFVNDVKFGTLNSAGELIDYSNSDSCNVYLQEIGNGNIDTSSGTVIKIVPSSVDNKKIKIGLIRLVYLGDNLSQSTAGESYSTVIVRNGSSPNITVLGTSSVYVTTGTTVDQLKAQIKSKDGSLQVYNVTTSVGVGKTSGALVTGDKLVITAEDGTTFLKDEIIIKDEIVDVDIYWKDTAYSAIDERVNANTPTFRPVDYSILDFSDLINRNATEEYFDSTNGVPGNIQGSPPPSTTPVILKEQLVDDYTKAINTAIERCSADGGGRVIIPAASDATELNPTIYYTGAITLKSNVNLHIEKNVVVKFMRNISNEYYPMVLVGDKYDYSPFVYSFHAVNIALTGEGTLDGQADYYNWNVWALKESPNAFGQALTGDTGAAMDAYGTMGVPMNQRIFTDGKTPPPALIPTTYLNRDNFEEIRYEPISPSAQIITSRMRPSMIQFNASQNILVDGVKVRCSPNWEFHPFRSENVLIRNVDINSHLHNNDGIDPESTTYVVLENNTISTGDDCMAIKAGMNRDGATRNEPSNNIIIRNNTFADGHGGVTLGSEVTGGVEDIFATNNYFDSPNLDMPLRFKTNSDRGGYIRNIYLKDSVVNKAKVAVVLAETQYGGGADLGPYDPVMENLFISNITTSSENAIACVNAIKMTAYERSPISNVYIKDCSFLGISAGQPVFFLSNVKNFVLDGMEVSVGSGTPTTYNTSDLSISEVKLSTENNNSIDLAEGTLSVLNDRSKSAATVTGVITTAIPSFETNGRVYLHLDRGLLSGSTTIVDRKPAVITKKAGTDNQYEFSVNIELKDKPDYPYPYIPNSEIENLKRNIHDIAINAYDNTNVYNQDTWVFKSKWNLEKSIEELLSVTIPNGAPYIRGYDLGLKVIQAKIGFSIENLPDQVNLPDSSVGTWTVLDKDGREKTKGLIVNEDRLVLTSTDYPDASIEYIIGVAQPVYVTPPGSGAVDTTNNVNYDQITFNYTGAASSSKGGQLANTAMTLVRRPTDIEMDNNTRPLGYLTNFNAENRSFDLRVRQNNTMVKGLYKLETVIYNQTTSSPLDILVNGKPAGQAGRENLTYYSSQSGTGTAGSYPFYIGTVRNIANTEDMVVEIDPTDGVTIKVTNTTNTNVQFAVVRLVLVGTVEEPEDPGVPEGSYTITYHANGGTGTTVIDTVEGGTAYRAQANTFTAPEGKEFYSWTDGNGNYYNPNARIAVSENIILSAVWANPHYLYGDGSVTPQENFPPIENEDLEIVIPPMAYDDSNVTIIWNKPDDYDEIASFKVFIDGVEQEDVIENFKNNYPAGEYFKNFKDPAASTDPAFSAANFDPDWQQPVTIHTFKATGLDPDTDYEFQVKAYDQGESEIFASPKLMQKTMPERVVLNIEDFGATDFTIADLSSLTETEKEKIKENTHAIQSAINAAEPGDYVLIPAGKEYFSGALYLHSDMTLDIEGTLSGSPNIQDYPLSGFTGTNRSDALLNAGNKGTVNNLRIIGKGTINGNGWKVESQETDEIGKIHDVYYHGKETDYGNGYLAKSAMEYYFEGGIFDRSTAYSTRPNLTYFSKVNNLYFEDITAVNPGMHCVVNSGSSNVVINGVIVQSYDVNNGDGFGPGRRFTYLMGSLMASGDDIMPFGAGNGQNNVLPEDATDGYAGDAWMLNNYFRHGHGVLVAGSGTAGWIKNILFEDNIAYKTDDGLRCKSNLGSGGGAKNIIIRDSAFKDISASAFTLDLAYNGTPPNIPAEVNGQFKDMEIYNVSVDCSPLAAKKTVPINVVGCPNENDVPLASRTYNKNINFTNVKFRGCDQTNIEFLADSTFDNVSFINTDGTPMQYSWGQVSNAKAIRNSYNLIFLNGSVGLPDDNTNSGNRVPLEVGGGNLAALEITKKGTSEYMRTVKSDFDAELFTIQAKPGFSIENLEAQLNLPDSDVATWEVLDKDGIERTSGFILNEDHLVVTSIESRATYIDYVIGVVQPIYLTVPGTNAPDTTGNPDYDQFAYGNYGTSSPSYSNRGGQIANPLCADVRRPIDSDLDTTTKYQGSLYTFPANAYIELTLRENNNMVKGMYKVEIVNYQNSRSRATVSVNGTTVGQTNISGTSTIPFATDATNNYYHPIEMVKTSSTEDGIVEIDPTDGVTVRIDNIQSNYRLAYVRLVLVGETDESGIAAEAALTPERLSEDAENNEELNIDSTDDTVYFQYSPLGLSFR